jgi:hypothetical protein
MLGKLAKALRMLGFDCLYAREWKRNEILKKSMEEDRIILTRSHDLPKREKIFILEDEDPEKQIMIVLKKFHLFSQIKPFTRCIKCNTKIERVDKEFVKGNVPFYVYNTMKDFGYCKTCNKFYWKGTHYKNMEEKIKKIVGRELATK